MPHEIKTGAVLVREGTRFPDGLHLESEPCVSGWRLVTNFDPYALDRKLGQRGWTFFCLAGQIRATVFGIDDQSMVRRAIERILIKRKPEECNSLEITGVEFAGSSRFPLVHYAAVSAQSRQVQESRILVGAREVPGIKPREAVPRSLGRSAELVSSAPLSEPRMKRLDVAGS